MSKPKWNNTCGGCCITGGTCDCVKCYPRILCVKVKVEPTAYATGFSATCCGYDFMLFCSSRGSWYGGNGGCGPGTGFSIAVNVQRDDYGECFTEVIINDYDVFEFVGVVPTMNIAYQSDANTELSITIEKANVVANPLINAACSPCSGAATCLPSVMCVSLSCDDTSGYVTLDGTLQACIQDGAGYAAYNFSCDDLAWLGPTIKCTNTTYTVTIALLAADPDRCGVVIHVSDNDYNTYSREIIFHNQTDAFFSTSFTLNDGSTLAVRAAACGDCLPQPCCRCSDGVQLPDTLHLTIVNTCEAFPGESTDCAANNSVQVIPLSACGSFWLSDLIRTTYYGVAADVFWKFGYCTQHGPGPTGLFTLGYCVKFPGDATTTPCRYTDDKPSIYSDCAGPLFLFSTFLSGGFFAIDCGASCLQSTTDFTVTA